MYLSKVTINRGQKLFELLAKKRGSDGYAIHQLLWSLFPNDGKKNRDFLYHKEEKSPIPSFYVISEEEPIANDILIVQSKLFTPQLTVGQRLVFTLVANPVIARKTEGKKNSVKHDVWMDAKKQGQKQGLSREETERACELAAKEWLIRQGERCGFSLSLNSISVDGHLQNRFYKGEGKHPILFNSIHYEGILTVTEPAAFTEMLGKGLGKSKAFGCGMMLVKRT